jgi:hypothetical protein
VAGVEIHLDRVIDHQVHRHERVDRLGLATEAHDAIAHRREVDDRRHASEILHEDARGSERHLFCGGALFRPIRDRLRILYRVSAPVLESQNVL